MDYIIRCDTTKGTWQRCEKYIILTTDCKSVDAKDNVLQISPIEFSDSIKLKVVNFSDSSPVEMVFSYFDETDNRFIMEKTTNKDGVVMLPDRVIPFYNHVGSRVTDYCDEFLYEDNELVCIFTPFGRITPMETPFGIQWRTSYSLTDHLGNVRVDGVKKEKKKSKKIIE